MTKIQKKVVELLVELDELCRSNGISYTLFGRTAVMASQTGCFYNEDYLAEVAMTADNYRRFLEVCSSQLPEGRELENALSNPKMDGLYSRYVNSETTLIDNRRGLHYKAKGIYVNIVPLLSSKPSSRLERFKERCVIANSSMGLKAETNTKGLKNKIKTVILILTKGLFSNAGSYFRKSFAGTGKGKTLYCRNLQCKRMKFRSSLGESYTDVTFEGHRLMSFGDVEAWVNALGESACYRKVEENAWRAGVFGVTGDAYVSYRELIPDAARAGVYGARANRDYDRFRRFNHFVYQPKADKEAADWMYVTRTKQRFDLWEKYKGRSDELIAKYEAGDTELVRKELGAYMKAIRKYAEAGMGFSIDRELFDICLKLLEEDGENKLAKKARKLLPKEYRQSVGEFLAEEGFTEGK